MFAEIIPLTKLPRNLAYFDYSIPEELAETLKVGQIVLIPWRRQKIYGLVFKIKKTCDFDLNKTKAISGLVNFIFSPEELEFMMNISRNHFVSPSLIINDFWQAAPLKIHATDFDWAKFYGFEAGAAVIAKDEVPKQPRVCFAPTGLAMTARLSQSFAMTAAPRCTLLLNNQKNFKYQSYQKIIDDNKENKNQTLIIFSNVQTLLDFAKTINTDDCLIISHKIKQKKNLDYTCWQAIVNHEKTIILGTRVALFYPWRNLKQIIVDQAEHPDYKQEDANPRYHGVDLALDLSEKLNIPILLECLTPRPADYYQAKKDSKKWQIINKWEKISARQRWIAMPTRDNEHPLISAELEERAQTVATKKNNVLILHNRKHFSNELYCPNCKEILLCPNCQVSYVFDQKSKGIYCPNCQKPLAENRCPHCKQRDYQYKQFGLENLLQYWKNKYPDNQVFNIEQKKYSEKEELALRDSLLNSDPGKIIIATNYIFSLVPKNYFQLIGITQSDQLLNIADFNSHWRLFSQLAQLIQHCAEENIELCLQSWQKQHFVMKALKEYNYPQFYKEELKWRQNFDYPPFQRLVKIIYQNEDVKNGDKIVANTWNDLQTRLVAGLPAGFSAADSGINAMPAISGGYQAMHKQLIQTQRNTRWRWLIWFKIEEKAWSQNQALNTYLKQLPEDFFVDISPENLYR